MHMHRMLNTAKLTFSWAVRGLGYEIDKYTTRSGPLSRNCPEDTKPSIVVSLLHDKPTLSVTGDGQ